MTAVRTRMANVAAAVRARPGLWWGLTLGFPVAYYVILLATLMIRFQAWPNYVTTYDWFGNVAEIVRSTPSFADMLMIIPEEWLFEIGFMNYDYGNGISEWSMSLVPTKIVLIATLAAASATMLCLVLGRRGSCAAARLGGSAAAGAAGATFVGITNITLSWVVCCATPNWVVGLAILGVGVSTSLWMEQFGPWIEAGGVLLMLGSLYWLAGQSGDGSAAPSRDAATGHKTTHTIAGAASS